MQVPVFAEEMQVAAAGWPWTPGLESSGQAVPSAATFPHPPEQAQGYEHVEFSPGQLAGDRARGGELTTCHHPMGASELQGDLSAATQAMTWLTTLDAADPRALFCLFKREVLGPEPSATLQDHRFLKHGLQLADVARPAIGSQPAQRTRCQAIDRESVAGVDLAAEVLDEERQVLGPLA